MTGASVLAGQAVLNRHAVHLVTIGGPSLAIAGFATVAQLRANRARRTRTPFVPHPVLTALAAACGLIATAVHIRVAPEHFHEAIIFGVFFTVTAVCQLGWSIFMLARPKRWTVLAGLVGNAAIVLLWAYTRLVAVPLGPDAGSTEEIGRWDIIATAAEAGLVATCLVLLIAASRRTARRTTRAVPAVG